MLLRKKHIARCLLLTLKRAHPETGCFTLTEDNHTR